MHDAPSPPSIHCIRTAYHTLFHPVARRVTLFCALWFFFSTSVIWLENSHSLWIKIVFDFLFSLCFMNIIVRKGTPLSPLRWGKVFVVAVLVTLTQTACLMPFFMHLPDTGFYTLTTFQTGKFVEVCFYLFWGLYGYTRLSLVTSMALDLDEAPFKKGFKLTKWRVVPLFECAFLASLPYLILFICNKALGDRFTDFSHSPDAGLAHIALYGLFQAALTWASAFSMCAAGAFYRALAHNEPLTKP